MENQENFYENFDDLEKSILNMSSLEFCESRLERLTQAIKLRELNILKKPKTNFYDNLFL